MNTLVNKTNMDVEPVSNIKTNDSLARKTKKELVDIILRKDDVERRLRETIEGLNKTINKLKIDKRVIADSNNILDKDYQNMKDNYEHICDEYATYRCEVNTKLNVMVSLLNVFQVLF